jgi:uncharacterized membrane protein (Fun14 family)
VSKAIQGAVIALLASLVGAGILGLFHLQDAVIRLTVQVEELQKAVVRLERTQTYLHGKVESQ